MKKTYLPIAVGLLLLPPASLADHHLEEVIVSASMNKTAADTALPINVLSGEALRRESAKTLGETLSNQVGVTSASFGPGVGMPVIRGQSGNRVQVLQDSVGTLDASAVSPDHGNAVEALIAERIEVVRGPATLLYGNGAIGGVVNVIDNRVPDTIPDTPGGALELRHNSVSDEDSSVFKVDGGSHSLAWHVDGLYRERNNVEIHGDTRLDKSDPSNSRGFIPNSSGRSKNLTTGASWVADSGFLGLSVSRMENNYGLPPGEEDADIRLDMEQTRIDIKSEWQLDGFVERLTARISHNDYEHRELEIAGGNTDVGTVYHNQGIEGRFTASHGELGPFTGVLGLQLGSREFGAQGEEAFIPTSDIQSMALFLVETLDTETLSYEFGLRGERQRIKPRDGCNRQDNTLSASASALWQASQDSNLLLAFNRSQRAPTIEENYSNIDVSLCQPLVANERVEHAATALLEVGNPKLDRELSHNLELGWRKHGGPISGELSLYYNEIQDFVYLARTGTAINGVAQAYYRQQTAAFSGYEAQMTVPLAAGGEQSPLRLKLFSDSVRARLKHGGNVPRIPPLRYGAELAYHQLQWSVILRATHALDQRDLADEETPTGAYTRLDLHADYHLTVGDRDVMIFARASNLLDQTIRNHSSFLKDSAPEPARGVELGLRLSL